LLSSDESCGAINIEAGNMPTLRLEVTKGLTRGFIGVVFLSGYRAGNKVGMTVKIFHEERRSWPAGSLDRPIGFNILCMASSKFGHYQWARVFGDTGEKHKL
jgi:hypothetical protein